MNFVFAETIKQRRTLINHLVLFGPVLNLILCMLLVGFYNIQTFGTYWWYTFMVPGLIALFCVESERKEKKSGNDSMQYTYPINLFKCRWASMIVIIIKIFMMDLVMTAFLTFVAEMSGYLKINVINMCLAMWIIFLSYLWLVPFCLIFGRYIGGYVVLIAAIIVNMIATPFLSGTRFWIVCPLSIGPKIVERLTGIMVSGDFTEAVGLNMADYAGIVIALVVFLIFGTVEAKIFAKGYRE